MLVWLVSLGLHKTALHSRMSGSSVKSFSVSVAQENQGGVCFKVSVQKPQ